jgi:hypothetical protein
MKYSLSEMSIGQHKLCEVAKHETDADENMS